MARPNDPPPNIQSNTNANAAFTNATTAHILLINIDANSIFSSAGALCTIVTVVTGFMKD